MGLIIEGKVKKVFSDPENSSRLIIEYTDSITAGDGEKKDSFEQKGIITCDTSQFFLEYIQSRGISTHYIKRLDGPRILCHKVSIFPLEVVCRNFAAGSFCRRYGLNKGQPLSRPLVEFFVKDDALKDPLITADALVRLGMATAEELDFIRAVTFSVNYYLKELLAQVELRLVDFKLEFGKDEDGQILLADEISGDTIRAWDKDDDSLDKDLFRDETGNVVDAYVRLLNRLKETNPDEVPVRNEYLRVMVLPKDGIKNPPGEVTKRALTRLGFKGVEEVRAGRIYDITIKRPISPELLDELHDMNMKLLSNPISEKTQVRLE